MGSSVAEEISFASQMPGTAMPGTAMPTMAAMPAASMQAMAALSGSTLPGTSMPATAATHYGGGSGAPAMPSPMITGGNPLPRACSITVSEEAAAADAVAAVLQSGVLDDVQNWFTPDDYDEQQACSMQEGEVGSGAGLPPPQAPTQAPAGPAASRVPSRLHLAQGPGEGGTGGTSGQPRGGDALPSDVVTHDSDTSSTLSSPDAPPGQGAEKGTGAGAGSPFACRGMRAPPDHLSHPAHISGSGGNGSWGGLVKQAGGSAPAAVVARISSSGALPPPQPRLQPSALPTSEHLALVEAYRKVNRGGPFAVGTTGQAVPLLPVPPPTAVPAPLGQQVSNVCMGYICVTCYLLDFQGIMWHCDVTMVGKPQACLRKCHWVGTTTVGLVCPCPGACLLMTVYLM